MQEEDKKGRALTSRRGRRGAEIGEVGVGAERARDCEPGRRVKEEFSEGVLSTGT